MTATPCPRHPRITEIEQHGINTIPDADRTSGPRDLFRIQFGGANTFATVLIGTTPIMLGLSLGQAVLATVLGAVVIVVVVYGYEFMLLVNKVVVVANTVLMLLAVLAFAGAFSAGGPASGAAPVEYALGSFWPTFVLSVLIVMGNPVSFGAFLGDWSRYIPADTGAARLLAATLLAQLATLVPCLFGVLTVTLTVGRGDYVFTLIQLSPAWYAPLLMIVAFLGGLSTGTTSLYGTGLDFSSVFPRLSRVAASLLVGAVAFVFILAGRLLFDLTASVNAFIGAIVICTTPWMAIMMIGYVVRRGHYFPNDVQVFNQGRIGGRYWFASGVNWRPMTAWPVAAVVGLLFADYPPLVVGPLHDVAGGIDISLPVSLALAAAIYLVSLWVVREPSYAFGPSGPRWVPVRDAVPSPVTDDAGASAHRVARRVPNT